MLKFITNITLKNSLFWLFIVLCLETINKLMIHDRDSLLSLPLTMAAFIFMFYILKSNIIQKTIFKNKSIYIVLPICIYLMYANFTQNISSSLYAMFSFAAITLTFLPTGFWYIKQAQDDFNYKEEHLSNCRKLFSKEVIIEIDFLYKLDNLSFNIGKFNFKDNFLIFKDCRIEVKSLINYLRDNNTKLDKLTYDEIKLAEMACI